ncbi:MAG: HlyD family efflux transporter periplasmic adaptor subunit [Bacillota bacterium]|nr:HlyD family efflux transporter periplasmic adaptor subunit [Bacillota bacterium]
MNQNKKNNSNIVKVLIVLLLISFILYYVDNIRLDIKSYTAEKGSLENRYEGKGIIIKDEEVYYSEYTGSIKNYYKEGERIKKGALISSIFPDFQGAGISGEIDKINRAIETKENSQDSDENQQIIDELESQIQRYIIEKNYNEAFKIIEKYQANEGFTNEYTDMTLNELYDKKNELSASISNNNINIYSKTSGIVSYKIDNTEEIFDVDKIETFRAGNYNIVNLEENIISKGKINISEPFIKVINNFSWYIMINLKDVVLENNNYVKIRFKKNNEIVEGSIIKKQINNKDTFLIVEINKFFHEFFNERYIDIELIIERYEGIKIENSSIIEKEGKMGVYVIGASKIVKFYPIKVIGKNDIFSIIDEGSSYTINSRGQIELNGQSFYTVKLYDKIISVPEEVKEGQILK